MRHRTGDFDLFVGKQKVNWGVGDVSVLDAINPRNMEEFVAREDEFAKLPVLMVRGVYLLDNGSMEFIYQPFYEPTNMPLFGSDWAMINNEAVGAYRGEIDVDAVFLQGAKPGIEAFPEANAVNGALAGRWNTSGDSFDYQVQIVNGWELFPLFEFNPDFVRYLEAQPEGARRTLESLSPQEALAYAPLYESRPIRQTMVGGGMSGFLGDWTLRAEAASIHPQELYTTDFKLTEHTIATGSFGLDRFLPWSLYANVTYLAAWISGYPDEGLFLVDPYNHFVVGLLRGGYFDDLLTPELRVVYNIGRGDSMVNPRIPIRLADAVQLTLGAYLLSGEAETIFGQFSDNGFGYAQLRYAY